MWSKRKCSKYEWPKRKYTKHRSRRPEKVMYIEVRAECRRRKSYSLDETLRESVQQGTKLCKVNTTEEKYM